MEQSTNTLRPRAVADYLRHRFRIQPGEALCIALGEPGSRDNYQALTAWVVRALARFQDSDLELRIQRIETDLCVRMCEAGIIDQLHDTFPVPVSVIAELCEPRREPCLKEARRHRTESPVSVNARHLGLIRRNDAHE